MDVETNIDTPNTYNPADWSSMVERYMHPSLRDVCKRASSAANSLNARFNHPEMVAPACWDSPDYTRAQIDTFATELAAVFDDLRRVVDETQQARRKWEASQR